MVADSRVKKTILNAKVSLLFYFITLALSFFSRKIFLDYLGANFVGLTGTLGNILGYLNLAELGVGAAIGFNLYKPLQQNNREEIINLISIFGYYYRNIGLIVLGAAIVVSLFIPLIFGNTAFNYLLIFFAFYSFLISSLLGYFNNYRSVIFDADQRNYMIAMYSQSFNVLKTLLQMASAYYLQNLYLWVAIELIFGIIYTLVLNWRISVVYPWLKCSIARGKKEAATHPNILKSTKQIFIHKIKDFILNQSDQLWIFLFASLKMVAYYGNYVLLAGKITSLFSTVLNSSGAGVGNLVAEDNKPRILSVFWELMAMRYFIAGVVCFCLYILINPFIAVWLGKEYILSHAILIVFLVNQFIFTTRGTVDSFNYAYGHYNDIWAAWTEGILTIVFTLFFGFKYGLLGILIAKALTYLPIIVIWKPMYLFRDGFKVHWFTYWPKVFKYIIAFAVCSLFAKLCLSLVTIDPTKNLFMWLIYATLCFAVFTIPYTLSIIWFCPGGKDLIHRLPLDKFKIRKH